MLSGNYVAPNPLSQQEEEFPRTHWGQTRMFPLSSGIQVAVRQTDTWILMEEIHLLNKLYQMMTKVHLSRSTTNLNKCRKRA